MICLLLMNYIYSQHVTKPQLTSAIEGYHVCEQKKKIGKLIGTFCLAGQEEYTTMHAQLDYVILRLLM